MVPEGLSRRKFVQTTLAAAAFAARPQSRAEGAQGEETYQLYWGDLHNHNAVGYAQGTLERSIEIAREHLDFFAFTGHASWHDMPEMPGGRHMKWVTGFEAHRAHWPRTRELLRQASGPNFVALLGYEWHSSQFGDYCLIFPEDQPELFLPDNVTDLLDFAADRKALAIPHHVGYKQGWRGANWSYFRPQVSPIVEVFSEHGCTETDRAPHPMLRHSMGGRSAANTVQPQLRRGLRFGLVASSDNHRGYPGAYGEGVVGLWAKDLSAASLFEALRARRSYAATGDRIRLELKLNGRPMGSELAADSQRDIQIRVEADDALERIELVENGRVIERFFPADQLKDPPVRLPGRVKTRLQFGWGPWAALGMGRICSWDFSLKLEAGRILRAQSGFQSAPYHDELRDRLRLISPQELKVTAHTTREECFAEDPTKAVIVELEGDSQTVVTLQLRKPLEQAVRTRLVDLVEDNVVGFTGGFTSESYILHRLVSPDEYTARAGWSLRRPGRKSADWYYVRAIQHNGHMAWSSPIWVEGE